MGSPKEFRVPWTTVRTGYVASMQRLKKITGLIWNVTKQWISGQLTENSVTSQVYAFYSWSWRILPVHRAKSLATPIGRSLWARQRDGFHASVTLTHKHPGLFSDVSITEWILQLRNSADPLEWRLLANYRPYLPHEVSTIKRFTAWFSSAISD